MDTKSLERLEELERQEARWQEAHSDFKCHRCGALLGRVDWEEATTLNHFNPPLPTNLRTRTTNAVPLAGRGALYFTLENLLYDPEFSKRPYTDIRTSPLFVDIREGVRCRACDTETRLECLARPFRHASELARLRRKRHAQNACVETRDHVS